MSERDFICPAKRRKQDSDIDGEFMCGGEFTNGYGNNRRTKFGEPDGLEVTEYFMRRHNEPRLVAERSFHYLKLREIRIVQRV